MAFIVRFLGTGSGTQVADPGDLKVFPEALRDLQGTLREPKK